MQKRAAAKMKQFSNVVNEINRTLNEMILFENIVNTTLVFLVFYLILSVFDLHPMLALIPAVGYLGFYSYISLYRTSKPLMVESKYAPLKEKLRTAADNLDKDNPVVQELEYEVTSEMRNVGLSMFINPKTLSYKIFAVMVLSFLIIFATTSNLKLLDFARHKVPDIFERGPKGVGNFVATKLNTSEDIYGKEDVAKLGDKELNIRIKPVDFKVNVKEEGEANYQKFESTFPNEFTVKEAVAYEENIPQEQQELVKNYFKKLAEG